MSKRVVAAFAVVIVCALGIAAWVLLSARPDAETRAPAEGAPSALAATQTVAIATTGEPADTGSTDATPSRTAVRPIAEALRPGVVSVLTEDLGGHLPRPVEGVLTGKVEDVDGRRRTVDIRVERFAAPYAVSKADAPAWLVWPAGSLVRVQLAKAGSEPTTTPRLDRGRTVRITVRVSSSRGRMSVTVASPSKREGS